MAAGALLPLAETSIHTERFGTRHRAALGITEQTDAVVVVVSEENGQISLVERARIVRNLTEAGLAARDPGPARPGRRPARRVRLAIGQPAPRTSTGDRRGCASSAASSGRPPVRATIRRRRPIAGHAGRRRLPRPAADAAAAAPRTERDLEPRPTGCAVRRHAERRPPSRPSPRPVAAGRRRRRRVARGRPGAAVRRILARHRPQLAPQARGGRPRHADVRRPGPVAEHPDLRRARSRSSYVNEPADTVVLPSHPAAGRRRSATSRRPASPVATELVPGDRSTWPASTARPASSTSPIDVDHARYPRSAILGYDPQFATDRARRSSRPSEDVPVKVVHGPVAGRADRRRRRRSTRRRSPSPAPPRSSTRSISVRADVAIQSSGIDVDQDVPLVAVDKLGNALSPVEVTPATARVIDPGLLATSRAGRCRSTRSSPARRRPASRSNRSRSSPQVVLVAGDADQLAELDRASTPSRSR